MIFQIYLNTWRNFLYHKVVDNNLKPCQHKIFVFLNFFTLMTIEDYEQFEWYIFKTTEEDRSR